MQCTETGRFRAWLEVWFDMHILMQRPLFYEYQKILMQAGIALIAFDDLLGTEWRSISRREQAAYCYAIKCTPEEYQQVDVSAQKAVEALQAAGLPFTSVIGVSEDTRKYRYEKG